MSASKRATHQSPQPYRSRAASVNSDISHTPSYDYTTTQGFLDTPAMGTPAIMLQGEYPIEDATSGSYFDSAASSYSYSSAASQWTPEIAYSSLRYQSIPRSPSHWSGSEYDSTGSDPFHNPAQLDQMFSFCKSCSSATYNTVLCEDCTNPVYGRHALAPTWD
jgi:hypothetical protein